MELTRTEKEEIAQMVVNILTERAKRKINRNWLELREEIKGYCQERTTNVRWTTLQTKIYDAIRAVLGVSRLDEMNDEQVVKARETFEFIKQEREKNESEH